MIARKEFTFDSAHYLPNYGGKCKNLHGHTYKLIVEVERAVGVDSDMVLDFTTLSKIVKETIIERYDHKCLNDLREYQYRRPTAENMVQSIWIFLNEKLPDEVDLHSITLFETPTSSITYMGGE